MLFDAAAYDIGKKPNEERGRNCWNIRRNKSVALGPMSSIEYIRGTPESAILFHSVLLEIWNIWDYLDWCNNNNVIHVAKKKGTKIYTPIIIRRNLLSQSLCWLLLFYSLCRAARANVRRREFSLRIRNSWRRIFIHSADDQKSFIWQFDFSNFFPIFFPVMLKDELTSLDFEHSRAQHETK